MTSGFLNTNYTPMVLSLAIKPDGLSAAAPDTPMLTLMKLSVMSSNLPPFAWFSTSLFHAPSPYINLTSRMLFSMALPMKLFIASSPPVSLIPHSRIMFVSFTDPYTVSNRLSMHGANDLLPTLVQSRLSPPFPTLVCSSLKMTSIFLTSFCMLTISS